MPYSPASVSGLFAWFTADSLGLSGSGTPVTYWKDLSGSGNNIVIATSSSPYIPNYYPNVVNGYPVVRFSGTNYLTTNSYNPSLTINNTGFSAFCVFSVTGVSTQNIYSLNAGTNKAGDEIIVGLNQGSGMLFDTTSTSLNLNSGIPYNKFVLRHDRFRLPDYQFMFGYFGIDVGSGSCSITSNTTAYFNVGASIGGSLNYSLGNFQGDIAEIAVYDKLLAQSDVNNINSYFIQKYFTPSSTPLPPFQNPSDLSGLFVWFRSTSIGVTGVDGSPVQYWPDDSGSGNNISINITESSSWNTPAFYRNQINGYPTVRFSNGSNYGYLYNSNSGNATAFSYTDLTTFSVFTPRDAVDLQTIYSFSDIYGNIDANISLNKQNNNSFNFSFTSNGSGIEIFTIANSPTMGTSLYTPGTFVIRHDRFREGDNEFMFGLYGADIASGQATTLFSLPRILTVGGLYQQSRQFIGDIAEIVAYNRELSTTEVQLVNQYLILKYQPGNVGNISIFCYGDTVSGIYKDIPLYAYSSYSGSQSNITLYTGSNLLINSGISLYEYNYVLLNSGISLYIPGSIQQYPPITLYLCNESTSQTGIPLYVGSTQYINNNIPIYISGSTAIQQYGTTLYIGQFPASSGISLYIPGSIQQYPPLDLYTLNIGNTTGNIDNILLYTNGWSPPLITSGISIFTAGTPSGTNQLYSNIPIYLNAGSIYGSLPLYVGVIPVNTNPSGMMPLFIGDNHATGIYNGYFSLFIANNISGCTSPTKRFYTCGLGELDGGSISTSKVLPIFLQQSGVTPIISGSSNNITLYTQNNFTNNTSLDLYTVSYNTVQSGISIYEYGNSTFSGGITTYTTGRNISFEEYTTMYIRGY